jgi:hypothetical protein
MASFGEGDAVSDLLWVIGVIILLGVIWFIMGGPALFQMGPGASSTSVIPDIIPRDGTGTGGSASGPLGSPSADQLSKPGTPPESQAKGKAHIYLGRSSDGANTEYAVIEADYNNPEPLNISGWKIDNGGNARFTEQNGKTIRTSSIVATIPKGTELLTGLAPSHLTAITLPPGGRAYVISGFISSALPYVIDSSFRINKCSGYIANYTGYHFEPYLSAACPSYDTETKHVAVAQSCADQIRYRYGSNCHTPADTFDPIKGTTLDNLPLSESCRALVKNTFNYSSCLARHSDDEDFLTDTWYIYLRRSWGMYLRENATITLYDNFGRVVDTYKY